MRLVRLFLVIALAMVGVASTASASDPFPDSIPLPDDFAPEGIAVGTGSSFFVGSLADGDIYRGDLRSGTGSVFVDAPPGRFALGLKVDQPRHLLIVAGGPTGVGYAYDVDDGSPVDDVQLAAPNTSLINDVVVTADAAYFTNSLAPAIYKVPIAPDGTLGDPETITVTGPAAADRRLPESQRHRSRCQRRHVDRLPLAARPVHRQSLNRCQRSDRLGRR